MSLLTRLFGDENDNPPAVIPLSYKELVAECTATFNLFLELDGFQLCGNRRWIRDSKTTHRELFILQPLKGLSLAPQWGVSIDWIPHLSGSSIRWHRTNSTARFDLCFDPLDYSPPDTRSWQVSPWEGLDSVRKTANEVAHRAWQSANNWFSAVNTVEAFARAFEDKKVRPFVRFGFMNYVQEPLAYAFVLAKLGRTEEAAVALNAVVERDSIDTSLRTRLERLLGSINTLTAGRSADNSAASRG